MDLPGLFMDCTSRSVIDSVSWNDKNLTKTSVQISWNALVSRQSKMVETRASGFFQSQGTAG